MTKLFSYGAEGGGASVYRNHDGSVVETGTSGGILYEDEDPVKTWEKRYDSFEAWWKHFTEMDEGAFCKHMSVVFIAEEVKGFVRDWFRNANITDRRIKERWWRVIEKRER